ncbi:MAG TPA: hypothetical protein PKW28_11725, partial [Turneriella sp.]|nr:hypothetical protein [Turneriella sp.]
IIMETFGRSHRESLENVEAFLDKHAASKQEEVAVLDGAEETRKLYKLHIEYYYDFENLRSAAINFTAASAIIPRNFVVAMVSQFDAFVGKMIRALFTIRPELLNSSEKNISFSNLMQFKSLDDAREFVLEKEVEAVLRENHAEHFDWFERKLGMELRKGLDIWPIFIELTERRNLFVHADGIISSQYLATCSKHKCLIPKSCGIGTRLDVNPDYFQQAYYCLFEIATKLSQVLWRKLVGSVIRFSRFAPDRV